MVNFYVYVVVERMDVKAKNINVQLRFFLLIQNKALE